MERIEGLSIGLDLNTMKLDSGLTDLKSKLSLVNSEMKANLSAFDKGDRSIEKYQTTIDALNKKMEVQRQITDKARKSYEKAVKEFGEGSKEADKAAQNYNHQSAALQNLDRRIQKTTDQMQKLQKEQNQSITGWDRFRQSSKKVEKTLTDIGDKAKQTGQTLSASVTAPLVGLGIFAGKSALDFSKATGVIQAEIGATGEEAERLQEVAERLWEKGFGDNIDSVAVKVAGVTKSLGELNDVDLENVTRGLDLFEKRGWADQQEALRAMNILMESFGLTASEAMDYLTKGFQENLDFSGEFLDSVSEYSTYFAEMGLDVEDMFAKFGAGEEAAFQLDKIGDSMKEFTIRAKDGSKASTDAFEALGLNAADMTKQFNAGGDTAKKAFETVVKALKNTDDETKRNSASVGLFGTQYEDLGEKAFDAMLEASEGLENVEGATKKASDALQNNLGARASKVWRGFLADMQPVGETLVDLGEDYLPKVADTIDRVTSAFTDLSPEGQKTILLVGGLAAATGPLIAGLGFASTGVSALMGGLALLTGPVGLTVAAVAGLAAGFVLLDQEMDKPVIKSDIFAGAISDATEKAVGAYMKLDEDATAELNSLAWSSQTITDEMANNMITKYQSMGDQILAAMKENHTQQLEEQQRLFDQSAILTEEEEAKRIAKLKANQLSEIEAHNENQARIKEIWTLASDEKRGITDAEAQEIARLQEQMRLKAVEELSASQEEQETILTNLKNNKTIIEAESAAKTVQKSMETRDKVVKEANKQYNETVAAAEDARDNLGIISHQEAEAIIKEAGRKKDEAVSLAQDMHYDVVGEARAQANEHADEINWETGQVLSGWDSMYNGVISAVNWIRGLFDKAPLKKKGAVTETGRQKQRRQNARLQAYAIGTPATGHPGGPAIVGEEGFELAHIPGQGVTLLGARGPEFHGSLPKGTSVLPNRLSEKLLKSYGFPGYKDGIGDYFDTFLKGAGNVWGMVKNKFGLTDSVIPSWLNKHTGSPLASFGKLATGMIKSLWDSWFSSNSDSMQKPNFGGKFRFTSGFGQRWGRLHGGLDYAAPTGTPIPSQSSGTVSFASNGWNGGFGNLVKVRNGIYEHLYAHMSRILTSVGQRVSKGSILGLVGSTGDSTGPHVHYELRKNGVRVNPGAMSFATGGLINNAGLYNLAEEGWGEWIIPKDPARRTDAMKLLALAARDIQGNTNNKRPNQLPNPGTGTGNGNAELLQAVMEQNRILLALLQSSQNIERKPVISEGDIGRAANRYDATESMKHSIYTGRVAF